MKGFCGELKLKGTLRSMKIQLYQYNSITNIVTERVCVIGRVLCGLTIAVLLTAFPETSVEVSESELVFTRLPDVVNRVGQLPLPDLGQLVPPGWRQRAVVRVLSGTLCVTAQEDDDGMTF